jgi:3',5'-cyclic-AMP phosphodiesterase
MSLKIALITDIHHGPPSLSCPHTKDTAWPVLPAVERFVDRAIAEKADVVIDLGDHVADADRNSDWRHASELATVFSRFPGERVHLLGNHDVVNLSPADNEAIFGCSFESRIVELGALRLIVWQPGVALDYGNGGGFGPVANRLDWLVEALLADERPAIIATHVSLSGRSQIGNYYHQRHPHYSTYPDHATVREAVEGTGRAALWLAGHSHWNTLTTVGNVHHITIQSLTERFTTYPMTAAAHADLHIRDGQFTLDVHGNDPFHLRLPFRKSGDRPWLRPLAATGPRPRGAVVF